MSMFINCFKVRTLFLLTFLLKNKIWLVLVCGCNKKKNQIYAVFVISVDVAMSKSSRDTRGI